MISVIIPSYNQAEYLSDAIDSALAQTVQCEIIIVDDGSTDGSLEIARGYEKTVREIKREFMTTKEYPVKVISQVNKGLASARNTGIMNATSSWILPLDADDILMDNCIEKITETISKGGVDVVAPSFKTFGTSNEEYILHPCPVLEDFKIGNRIGYCAAISKQALLEVGGYSPKMVFGYEDLHLWYNLLTKGKKIVTIPEILWLYRTKEKSMWTDAKEHHEELIAQIKKDFPNA